MMFGNDAIRFDVIDATTKLMHLRKLHKVVEAALLEFPFIETEKHVSTVTSEPWDEPVPEAHRKSLFWSNQIKSSVMVRFQRQSALCTAYAVFEFTVFELARNLRIERGLEANPPHERKTGLSKASWLFTDAGCNFSMFSKPTWKECLDIAAMRHQIMHNGGLVPLDKQQKFSMMRGVYFEHFADGTKLVQLCIDYDYIPRLFRVFEDFLEGANSEIERKLASC